MRCPHLRIRLRAYKREKDVERVVKVVFIFHLHVIRYARQEHVQITHHLLRATLPYVIENVKDHPHGGASPHIDI